MCDIFPEINNCCLCISGRLALHFIAILSIMTGVTGLSIMIKQAGVSYHKFLNITDVYHNITADPHAILSNVSYIVMTGVVLVSAVFMLAGVILFLASLIGENEGYVQIFVWAVFLNVLLGFFLIIAVCVECIVQESCMLAGLDWVTAAFILIALIIILLGWIYYISIANTYATNA